LNGNQNEYQQSKTISLTINLQNGIDIHYLLGQILTHFQHVHILITNNECKRHYKASIDEFTTEKWKEIISDKHDECVLYAMFIKMQ